MDTLPYHDEEITTFHIVELTLSVIHLLLAQTGWIYVQGMCCDSSFCHSGSIKNCMCMFVIKLGAPMVEG